MIKKLNYNLMIGWAIIVVVLFVSYCGEFLKGERTIPYLIVFSVVTIVPLLYSLWKYKKDKSSYDLRYNILAGYFVMYVFVMLTGSTTMVFCYILPLLSYLVLYHQPALIMVTGIATLIINIVSNIYRLMMHQITLANSKDVEIQFALLILCFMGSYFASRIYDEIENENEVYLHKLKQKNEQIREMTLQTIMTIANTIDAKDNYTRGHSKRVSEYSVAIAREVGMDEKKIADIRYIALLHDIGKIGIPDSVLNKPGRLTDNEYDMMKQHTVIGGKILKDIKLIEDIDIGAKHHHERYDGKGYPDGMKGLEIPEIARLIAVADAFDAMTSNRVYRKKLSKETVMNELENGKGTQFDPKFDEALIALVKENRLPDVEGTIYTTEEDSTDTILRRVIEQNEQKIYEEVKVDQLTGAYNRSFGEKLITDVMKKEKGCLAYIDIDNFRLINNKFGYKAGDAFLKKMVECLQSLDEDQIIVRIGSDEFITYFPQVDNVSAVKAISKQCQEKMQALSAHTSIQEGFTISAGWALCEISDTYLNLFSKADKALYVVKQQGGNGCYIHHHNQQKFGNTVSGTRADLAYFESHMKEDDNNTFAVLFTMNNNVNMKITLEEKTLAMSFLSRSICVSIREEDHVYDFSDSQKMVLLSGVEKKEAELVADRVLRNFYRMYSENKVNIQYEISKLKKESANE